MPEGSTREMHYHDEEREHPETSDPHSQGHARGQRHTRAPARTSLLWVRAAATLCLALRSSLVVSHD